MVHINIYIFKALTESRNMINNSGTASDFKISSSFSTFQFPFIYFNFQFSHLKAISEILTIKHHGLLIKRTDKQQQVKDQTSVRFVIR